MEVRARLAAPHPAEVKGNGGGVIAPPSSLRAKRSNPSIRLWRHGLLRRFAPRNDELN
jgi:hypothetical protein